MSDASRPVCNIAEALVRRAAEAPQRVVIRCPGSRGADGLARYDQTIRYGDLDRRSDAIAAGLLDLGIRRGDRCVVMVRPSPEFFAIMFALFKAGIVPVLVDPGIDRRALRQCLDEAEPSAFIGVSLAQAARRIFSWAHRHVRHSVTVGSRWFWFGPNLKHIEQRGAKAGPQLADTRPDEIAAILFTSGSTGVPKGVVYRHRHFAAQIELLREAFQIQPGGVDMPTFPPFALFDPALGLTSVIPDMDPTRPAEADPRRLLHAIGRFQVDRLFGSPALMRVLANSGLPLGTLKWLTSAGAPVPPEVVATLRRKLPDDARFWTPYGATECLPVAVIEGAELAETREATTRGAGTCVGRPLPANTVRIIAIRDQSIAEWGEVSELPAGTIGEITVFGPSTTDSYFNRPQATAQAKIRETLPDGSQRIVHRMGDVGYFDEDGRLWFCGRKSQRVEAHGRTLYTEQVEPVFNAHPEVRRTALVGTPVDGLVEAVLVIELEYEAKREDRERIITELRAIAARQAHTAQVKHYIFHRAFPVDIRHNAKIGREQLAAWVAGKIG